MYKLKCYLPHYGKTYLNEINNKFFFDLHKYIIAKDYETFFLVLDEHINKTVDIKVLTLLDKVYAYIAIYAYCVNPSITVMNNEQPISYSLFDVLNQTENLKNEIFTYKFENNNLEVDISCPTNLKIEDDTIIVDIFSGIKAIRYNNISYEINDISLIEKIIPIQEYASFVENINDKFNIKLVFIKDMIELQLLGNNLFTFIIENIYNENFESIFNTLYSFLRHLNMQPNNFFDMLPIDTNLLLNKYISEIKEQEKKHLEESSQNNLDI